MKSVSFGVTIPKEISCLLLDAAQKNKFISNGHGGEKPVCHIIHGVNGESISVIPHPQGADIRLVTLTDDTLHISAKKQPDGNLDITEPAGLVHSGENIIRTHIDTTGTVKRLVNALSQINIMGKK